MNYLISLVESGNKKDWTRAVKDLGLDIHPDSLRKAFNVGTFSGYGIYKYMQEKIENGLLTNEEILRLEKARDEEYKERVRLQDANREKRKYLRDFSRLESLLEYIDKKLEARKPIDIPKFVNSTTLFKNEASLLVSDLHCGATVKSIFNKFDVDVLRKRMNELADKTISRCEKENIDILHVEFLGDFVTGIIHGSTIAQSQEDIIDQIFIVSDIIEEFLVKLRVYVPCVKGYFVYGNHGRVQKGKSDGANKENFERIVAPYIRKSLKNTDIEIIDSGVEDFVTYKLLDGRLIVATHGTRDNPSNANQVFSKLLRTDVYEVHMGHFHSVREIEGTTVNGSVMGSDDYSISIRKHTLPTQVLKIYYSDGDDCSHKLKLHSC